MPTGSGKLATSASLSDEATARADGDSANASDIQAMQARMPAGSGKVASQAALQQAEQTAADASSANASDITALGARMDTAEGDITANTGALTAIDSRVTTNEGNITSLTTQTTNLSAQLHTPWVNAGFESGTAGQTGAPAGWFCEVVGGQSQDDPCKNMQYYANAAPGSSGTLSYGCDVYNPGGKEAGSWALGKHFRVHQAGSTLTVTAQVCAQEVNNTTSWDGTKDAGQTFMGEGDAFIEVRCFDENGAAITMDAADQFSTTATDQDYQINGPKAYSDNTWLPLTHTLTIPDGTARLDVLLVASDGSNSVVALGTRLENSAIQFDDFDVSGPVSETGDGGRDAQVYANAQAIQQTQAEVSQQGDTLTSQGSSITDLENSLSTTNQNVTDA